MSVQKTKASNLRSYGYNLYEELTKQVTSKAEEVTANTGASRTAAMAAAAFLKVTGKPPDIDKGKEEPISEAHGTLNVEFAEIMLKWHAEAIGRCVELSTPTDVYVTSCSRTHR